MSTMTACGSKKLRKDVKFWLIDENDLVLYRKIVGGKEEVLRIPKNKEMHKFMCFDGDKLHDLVEGR